VPEAPAPRRRVALAVLHSGRLQERHLQIARQLIAIVVVSSAVVAAESPSGGAGLEVFVVSALSLQARVSAEWCVTLKAPQRFSLGVTVTGSTYFRRR
jgi:hypothetical protein